MDTKTPAKITSTAPGAAKFAIYEAAILAVKRCASGEIERPLTERSPWPQAMAKLQEAIEASKIEDCDNLALLVSLREFNTILAALRFWQRAGNTSDLPEYTIANDTSEEIGCDDSLSDDEIDALCERLNCG